MTDHCAFPKCGKELTHVEGRKKKKYCNQNCNTRHWQMLHPAYKPKTKRVPLEEYKKLTGKSIVDATEPTNKVEPQNPMGAKKTNVVINTTEPAPGTMAWFLKYGDKT